MRLYVTMSSSDLAEERELVFEGVAQTLAVLHSAEFNDMDVFKAIDDFRYIRADVSRIETTFDWPPTTPAESCRQCIECGAPASDHCEVCGLGLCSGIPRVPVPVALFLNPSHLVRMPPGC